MTRVLYLTMNPNCISTTVPTMNWLTQLPVRGLDPVVVSNTDGDFHRWATNLGIPAYVVPLPHPQKLHAGQFLVSLRRLISIAKHHGSQLVHCNEQNIYPIGQYVARWARWRSIPAVVSIHAAVSRDYCKWAFSRRRMPRRMYFVSGSLLEHCRKSLDGIVDASRCMVLPNALDMSRYGADDQLRAAFRRENNLDGCRVIGVACAMRPWKQLEHLFRAAAALPYPDLRVVVAGGPVPGDEAYAKALLDDARGVLGDRLIALGHRENLRDFFNGLDLFVNTSKFEAFGISVLESMACGCPVMGYPSGAVGEIVLPGGGEIVEQDNIDSLVQALRKWLDDPARLHSARAGALQRAQAFDARLFLDQLWNDYQLLTRSPNR